MAVNLDPVSIRIHDRLLCRADARLSRRLHGKVVENTEINMLHTQILNPFSKTTQLDMCEGHSHVDASKMYLFFLPGSNLTSKDVF